MAGIGDSIIVWIMNLVLPGSAIEDVLSNAPHFIYIFTFASLVLVLMTVSFLFKFILKLVDR